MYVTLIVAIIIAILDPIFIFGLGWGIQGAAVAGVLADLGAARCRPARSSSACIASSRRRAGDGSHAISREITEIAVPAMLTQLATPFANAYATRAVAPFGDDAVAACGHHRAPHSRGLRHHLLAVGLGRPDHRPELRRRRLSTACAAR